jgi:enamine deaminase RidA (YjgF/YER057c/UK114 family)
MHEIETRLQQLGLSLPEAAPAAAGYNYVPYVISGESVYIAGQIPFLNGVKGHFGKLGKDMDVEAGKKAAEACALNVLAQILSAIGGNEDKIVRCVKVGGFVNCTPDFTDMSAVINGASDLLVHALGDKGRHARFAVGAPSLPLGVAVEVDAVFEIAA